MADTTAPTFSGQVDQRFFIAPLGGPQDPQSLLDRFPDELYSKSPNSHFVRFMYALLGPAGVGWLAKNYLDARLLLEGNGISTFDIEKFYGSPLRFGRILTEQFTTDPVGLLPRADWDKIKAQDEGYRSRALTFFNAARAGGTVLGIQLAAQSGLDHPVEVIENYRYLFDQHTDIPLGLPYYGQTYTAEEFVIIPRREDSRSEVQTLSFEDTTISGGTFHISFRGRGVTIPWNANNLDLRDALQSLTTVGIGNVEVSGGPCPNDFTITFAGALSNQDVPEFEVLSALTDNYGTPKGVFVETVTGGVAAVDEIVRVDPSLEHNLQQAIDLLRPVASLPTFSAGSGRRERLNWREVFPSSQYTEVIRYVTGNPNISWPDPDSTHWVQANVENESRRIQGDLQHHFLNYHTPAGARAYTDSALDDPNYLNDVSVTDNYNSVHVGLFSPDEQRITPELKAFSDPVQVFSPDDAIHSCPDGAEVLTQEDNTLDPLIGGTISLGTVGRDGAFHIDYQDTRHWASLSRTPPAAEVLEIDFGSVRSINTLEFDIVRLPISIDVYYDKLDQHPKRDFEHVEEWPGHPYVTHVAMDAAHQSSFEHIKMAFLGKSQLRIYTRHLRIKFTRRVPNPFVDTDSGLTDAQGNPLPFAVHIKNLKVGHLAVPYTNYG